MTPTHHGRPPPAGSVPRITFALDAAGRCAAELDTAVRLAASLGTELEGLFVEDQDLLHLSTLAFTYEQRSTSSIGEALDDRRIEREMRVQARHAEQALRERAARARVECRFRVWRGSLGHSLVGELSPSEIVTLAPLGHWSPRSRSRVPPGVAILADPSDAGRRALEAAVALATEAHRPLTVIVPPTTEGQPLPESQRARLQQTALPYSVLTTPNRSLDDLHALLQRLPVGVLVIPQPADLLRSTPVRSLMHRLRCQLVAVR